MEIRQKLGSTICLSATKNGVSCVKGLIQDYCELLVKLFLYCIFNFMAFFQYAG